MPGCLLWPDRGSDDSAAPVVHPAGRPDGDHVATLTAWKFDSPYGADDALATLEKLQGEALIKLQDAAVVSWEPGRSKPKTRELHSAKKAGALGGGFWGLLFGLIFFVP